MNSKTLKARDYFEDNFSFSNDQLLIIEQTSNETGINKDIVTKLIYDFLLRSFIELVLDSEDEVTVSFHIFNLSNF